MRRRPVPVLCDFLLHGRRVPFFWPPSSATARLASAPPSQFWLTHSSFCSWQQLNPPRGSLPSTVPASTRLQSIPRFPSIRMHWYESSFPLVNCKPNFCTDCPGSGIIRPMVHSAVLRVGKGAVSGGIKHAHLGRRAHGPWQFSLEGQTSKQECPFQCPQVSPCKGNWIGMAAEHVESHKVQDSSPPHPTPPHSTLLQLPHLLRDLNLEQACLLAQAAPHSCKVPRGGEATWSLSEPPFLSSLPAEDWEGPCPSSWLRAGGQQLSLSKFISVSPSWNCNYNGPRYTEPQKWHSPH